jgi:hypothetical protein
MAHCQVRDQVWLMNPKIHEGAANPLVDALSME